MDKRIMKNKKEDKWLTQMTRRPTTPGDAVADLLESAGLSQSELARRIGVSFSTVNRLIQENHRLTPEMAQRLGRFFGDGPRIWIALQQQVDEWDLLHASTEEFEFIEPLHKAA
jgi:addiction module HigA family antidote